MNTIDEIIAYVMNTPGNTNPVILKQMILKAASALNEPPVQDEDTQMNIVQEITKT